MRAELRQEIEEQELRLAVIVDDAFDEPRPAQIMNNAQAFVDALDEKAFENVGMLLGNDDLNEDSLVTLLEQDEIVARLFVKREELPNAAADALFSAFDADNVAKREELQAISTVLTSAGLAVLERGSRRAADSDASQADIVFVDLFLNDVDAETAASDAAQRIESYLPERSKTEDTAPLVILISSKKPDLDRVNQRFRESASLPGCRFTFMHKKVFRDAEDEALFQLLQLVRHNDQSRQFDLFIRRMEVAAEHATKEFLSTLREFELSDYADLSELVVRDEGIPLRQYLLELFALAWASFAESNDEFTHALEGLDQLELTVEQYPPNAFVPSEAVLELYESALYRPSSALGPLGEFGGLGLGDILVRPANGDGPPKAYLVIAQDCDMARDVRPDAAFLIEGEIALAEKTRAQQNRFPLTLDNRLYSVFWDNKKWRALREDDFDQYIADSGLSRVMRLRSPWSLMRQSEFFQRLSRPAAMKSPHEIDAVDIEILLAGNDSNAKVVRPFSQEPAGFLLHFREGNAAQKRLVLSQSCAAELRVALRDAVVDTEHYRQNLRDWASAILSNSEQLQSLRTHLVVKSGRQKQTEPLDLVSVALEDKLWVDGNNTGGMYLMISAKSLIPAELQDVDVTGGDD